jgi:hypothetical protein
METTLRITDSVYREAQAEAARLGVTLTCLIEDALRARIASHGATNPARQAEIGEPDRQMESLLQATAHFRVGSKPTREEMHDR